MTLAWCFSVNRRSVKTIWVVQELFQLRFNRSGVATSGPWGLVRFSPRAPIWTLQCKDKDNCLDRKPTKLHPPNHNSSPCPVFWQNERRMYVRDYSAYTIAKTPPGPHGSSQWDCRFHDSLSFGGKLVLTISTLAIWRFWSSLQFCKWMARNVQWLIRKQDIDLLFHYGQNWGRARRLFKGRGNHWDGINKRETIWVPA